jgi:hypothetical protein
MKKVSFLILILFATLLISCKKDAQPTPDSAAIIASQKTIVTSSSWKVAFFSENGSDHTSDFSTMLFTFSSDGSAAAINNADNTTLHGSWNLVQGDHTTPDDSGNHSGTEENKFIMNLSGNNLVTEISEDWTIVKLTDTEMWLADDNATSPKEIHFVKK